MRPQKRRFCSIERAKLHFPDERGMSKSQVSRLCAEIDERVNAFLSRPVEGLIRMNSVPRTEFPTVRGTVGAVNGPASGSTRPM